MQKELTEGFRNIWDDLLENLPHIIIGIAFFLIVLGLGMLLRRVIKNRLAKRIKDQLLVNFIGRIIFLIFLVLGIIIFLGQIGLGQAASGILAGAGVSAIILGFAFKDIGENFLAGFFLAFSRPFSIGDIIEVLDKIGTVRALSFRNTHIRTFDGRDIYIPNAMLIKNPLTNYTKDGLLRHDFNLGLDYNEDLVRANQVILAELKQMVNIVDTAGLEPFVVINDFGTSTVNFKVYFWINTFEFKGSSLTLKSTVMRQVLERLREGGFNMPADIIEMKLYDREQHIPVAIRTADA